MIAEAEALLGDASRAGELGRYQVEAAIQSVHIDRLLTGADRWDALETLYALLVSVAPTFGVRIAQAAVMAEAGKPNHALDLLERLAGDVQAYQPYWATRGHVLRLLSRHDEARASFRSAAGLTEDDAVRSFLLRSADS
jgi:RNA polymerase sigma-70 factor (ECF subfamily)